jgi:hypothetical protein
MTGTSLFDSFFMAGFECSTHRRRDGIRLDLIRATGHDTHVASDYRQCGELGIRTIRDGLRWHLIEASEGVYDWSSWLPTAISKPMRPKPLVCSSVTWCARRLRVCKRCETSIPAAVSLPPSP